MTCNCLVELAHVFLDKTFTYIVPDEYKDSICVGMRVEVPFGKQVLDGFVMSISYEDSNINDLKSIIGLIDSYPVLNEELMEIGKFVKNVTLSSLMSSYQVMLPKALKAKNSVNMRPKFDKYVSLGDIDFSSYKFNKTQSEIISYVKDNGSCNIKFLNDISSSSVKTLINKGILVVSEREVYRYNVDISKRKEFSLNTSQDNVFKKISDSFGKSETFLLYGVVVVRLMFI